MSARGILLTGTDTDAGKTLVSCGLLRALSRRGLRVAAYKPVETGCKEEGGTLVGADCKRLASAAKSGQSPADVAGYLFRDPAAPLVAAEASGTTVDRNVLHQRYREVAANADFVLVETAGGLVVPLANGYTSCDFAVELGLPVVVVVASRLGCINHSLLTFEVLRRVGLTTTGYIMNEITAGGEYALALRTNRDIIGRFAGTRDLGAMPFIDAMLRCDIDYIADLAEKCIELDAI